MSVSRARNFLHSSCSEMSPQIRRYNDNKYVNGLDMNKERRDFDSSPDRRIVGNRYSQVINLGALRRVESFSTPCPTLLTECIILVLAAIRIPDSILAMETPLDSAFHHQLRKNHFP